MTAKQAAASNAKIRPVVKVEDNTAPVVNDGGNQTRNLFMRVDTFDVEGRVIGTRLVDLYHFGTRNWLQNHLWWAMHNSHTVETRTANEGEIEAYLAEQRLALAAKFNSGVC